jgi:poly-gamma-glutamate capsule biosynthesis protein CapA/YwtB (metallophosphatase superfamily)
MIKLSFVGDISLGEYYLTFGHGPRSIVESGKDIFENVSELFTDSDLVIGNLEGVVSDLGYDPESPHSRVFRGAPAAVQQLKSAGFNVLNIANNHCVQQGVDTIRDSIRRLEDAGITVIGLREKPITRIAIRDTSIAIIACSLIRDNTDTEQQVYFAPSEQELIDTVRRASQDNAFTLVYIHWGIEGTTEASPAQRRLATELKNAGARMVIGHHTHSLQPVIVAEDSLIAFSLGNFVFDLCWCYINREGTVLHAKVADNKIQEVHHHKLWLDESGRPDIVKKDILLPIGEHLLSDAQHTKTEREGLAKIIFFIKNLLKGETKVKLRFITWKLSKRQT